MSTISVGVLITVAVLILVAIAAGTLTARFFIAASRTHTGGAGSNENI